MVASHPRGYSWVMHAIATLLLVLCCASALAGEQDLVRRDVEAGRIRPLADILQAVQTTHPGKLLDVQLVSGPGGQRWYAVRLLQKDGSRTEVLVDAVTGQEVTPASRRPAGVLPMTELLRRSEALRAGTVLEMELESSPGLRAVYEVRLLLPTGARQVLRLDAYSGERKSRPDFVSSSDLAVQEQLVQSQAVLVEIIPEKVEFFVADLGI